MKRMEESIFWIMAASLIWPAAVSAEETVKAVSGYGGSDYVWFAVIAIVLGYGVYDTFLKTP